MTPFDQSVSVRLVSVAVLGLLLALASCSTNEQRYTVIDVNDWWLEGYCTIGLETESGDVRVVLSPNPANVAESGEITWDTIRLGDRLMLSLEEWEKPPELVCAIKGSRCEWWLVDHSVYSYEKGTGVRKRLTVLERGEYRVPVYSCDDIRGVRIDTSRRCGSDDRYTADDGSEWCFVGDDRSYLHPDTVKRFDRVAYFARKEKLVRDHLLGAEEPDTEWDFMAVLNDWKRSCLPELFWLQLQDEKPNANVLLCLEYSNTVRAPYTCRVILETDSLYYLAKWSSTTGPPREVEIEYRQVTEEQVKEVETRLREQYAPQAQESHTKPVEDASLAFLTVDFPSLRANLPVYSIVASPDERQREMFRFLDSLFAD